MQPHIVARIAALIEQEVRAGTYEPPVEPATLAYAIVRLAEAFLFNDAAAGMRGDVDRLRDVEAAILGVKTPEPGRRRPVVVAAVFRHGCPAVMLAAVLPAVMVAAAGLRPLQERLEMLTKSFRIGRQRIDVRVGRAAVHQCQLALRDPRLRSRAAVRRPATRCPPSAAPNA